MVDRCALDFRPLLLVAAVVAALVVDAVDSAADRCWCLLLPLVTALAFGHWLLATSCWLLTGYGLLVVGGTVDGAFNCAVAVVGVALVGFRIIHFFTVSAFLQIIGDVYFLLGCWLSFAVRW